MSSPLPKFADRFRLFTGSSGGFPNGMGSSTISSWSSELGERLLLSVLSVFLAESYHLNK
jgi:hypothetical protein